MNHIVLKNVSHTYGNVHVLNKLSLQVAKGEIVVIIGPSGCGKTTLLNILSGYQQPGAGHIEIKGIVRTVYQQDSLLPWLTVAENIGIGLRHIENEDIRKRKLEELISLVDITGFEKHYPYQLSGGMKQRVELGRILAGDSEIILMDEPFSALDYQSRIKMRKEMIRLFRKRPRTVVFVTHDIDEAVQLADRVIILSRRPTAVCHELLIDLPHPRTTTHPTLIEATDVILEKLGFDTDEVAIHSPS